MVRYQYSNSECFAVLKILVLLHIFILKFTSICNNLITKDTLSVPETSLASLFRAVTPERQIIGRCEEEESKSENPTDSKIWVHLLRAHLSLPQSALFSFS